MTECVAVDEAYRCGLQVCARYAMSTLVVGRLHAGRQVWAACRRTRLTLFRSFAWTGRSPTLSSHHTPPDLVSVS